MFKTAFSAFFSFAIYAIFWGPRFAAIVIVLLLIHELGHAIAYKGFGLGLARIGFVPFMGAYAMAKKAPENAWIHAIIALAGPFVGGLGAAAIWGYGVHIDSNLLRAAATFGFFLNLINLVPLIPFDGGIVVGAIHPYIWLVGIGGIALVFFRYPNILLLIFFAIGVWQAFGMLKRYRAGDPEVLRHYRSVTPWQRVVIVILYFGLAALLAIAMHYSRPPNPR